VEHLTQAQLHQLRDKLDAERKRLILRANSLRTETAQRTVQGGDEQDAGAEETRQAIGALLVGRDRARLAELEDALERVRDGSYGICEETDEPIPFARLMLEPTTRYTVEAQELLELEERRTGSRGESEAY